MLNAYDIIGRKIGQTLCMHNMIYVLNHTCLFRYTIYVLWSVILLF